MKEEHRGRDDGGRRWREWWEVNEGSLKEEVEEMSGAKRVRRG